MYCRKVFPTFFILGGVCSYGQLKIFTLEEAIDYAFKNAFSVQLVEQDIKIASAQIKEAEGKKGPQVKLMGNYLRNNKNNPPAQYQDNLVFKLNTSIPLDISKVISSGIKVAKCNQTAVEKTKSFQYINLKADIKNVGYDILLNSRLIKLNLDRQKTTESNLQNIEAKVNNKVSAKYDQYIATRDFENAKGAVLNAELAYKISKKKFSNLIGYNINQDFELQDIRELPTIELNKDDLLEECYHRPDVQALDQNIELQKYKHHIELGALAPSLGLSVEYTRSQKVGSKSIPSGNNLAGTANITIPLLDSGISKARAKQVEETILKLEIQKKQLLTQIELNLDNALDQLKNACQQLEVKKSGLAAAKEAYRIALLRFNEGQSIQLEVSFAKDSLTQISIDYDTSYFNALKAYNEIERIIGIEIVQKRN